MISLYHLKYFQDAALLGGVGAAAKKNHISPSAVSQAIKGLEGHFNVTLLRHKKNRFELTEEGRALLDRSYPMFTAAEKLEEEMEWAKAAYSGTFSFATQQSIAHHVLPAFLARLRAKYPGIRPKLRLATTDVVKRWLEQREVDFILSVDNVAYDSFRPLPILSGHYVLAESTKVKREQDAYLIPSGAKEVTIFRREYEEKYGVAPRVVMEIDSWGVIKRLAEQGLGIGLFPDYLLRFEKSPGLQLVDRGLPPIPYSVSAYYCSKRNTLSRTSRLFLDELEAYSATESR